MTANISKFEKICHQLTFASLFVLAAGVFTSVSFSALSHIFMVVPGLYFLYKNIKEKDFKPKNSFWALLALIIVCWLSVISNWEIMDRPFKQIFRTKYYIIGLLSTFAFYYTKRDYLTEKKKAFLFKLFIVATSIATISGLIGLWSGFNPLKFKDACHPTRACGLYGMYMTYGYGISWFTVLLTGLALQRKRFSGYAPAWLIWSGLLINLSGTIFSYARGGWLGLFLAVPFLFFKDYKKQFLSLMVGGLILLGGLIAFSPKVQNVFLNRTSSNLERIAFYKTAVKVFQEKPLLGIGFKNFEPNVVEYKKKYNIDYAHKAGHAHSNYFEHLASTGALGLICFLLFCFFWLKESYKEPILFSFVISFLITGLFQYTFGDGENVFFLMGIFSYFH